MTILDVLGPIMIGPSSSHTAGANKIGFLAARVYALPFYRVKISLYNSFAQTGKGHATDKAILSGLLGMKMDDENIPFAFQKAEEKGISFEFEFLQEENLHPNTAKISFYCSSDETKVFTVTGISVGGGKAYIKEINGHKVHFSGKHPVLLVTNRDKPGVLAYISKKFEQSKINIAYLDISRDLESQESFAVYKLDQPCSPELVLELQNHPHIIQVVYLPPIQN